MTGRDTAFAISARVNLETRERTPTVLAIENDHVRRLLRSHPG